ncbi:MAG TPA: alpha/beta fold hydrolase [Pseudonocardia sp.]|nr:alpha/beta fold hydrolase [Pseudonocardia sp.]
MHPSRLHPLHDRGAHPEDPGIAGDTLHAEGMEALLRARLRLGTGPVLAGVAATIVIDTGPGRAWTIRLGRDGALSAHRGAERRPDSHIRTDPATWLSILDGRESGIAAFLDGRLVVRGNLALSMHLDGIFRPGDRPWRFPRAGVVTAGGIRTTYLEAGAPDAPVVVALHGLGATNASLLPTIWELADDHRVIAPDLAGHGDSGKPVAPYDSRWFGRWLTTFCNALQLDEFVLLGNSLGGRIALEGGLQMPDRVRGLVLFTPSPAFRRLRQFVPLVRLLRPEMAMVPTPLSMPPAAVRSTIRWMFARPERLPDTWYDSAVDEFVRYFRGPRGRVAFFSCLRQIYLEDAFGTGGFWTRLPELAPPALFVWGDRDPLVPSSFARHVVDAVPHARSVVLPDCGHVPQFELPEQTHALVREFLDELPAIPPGRPAGELSVRRPS